MAKDPATDLSTAGVLSRSPDDIARVLAMLHGRAELLRSDLDGGKIAFESRLLLVDLARDHVVMDAGASELAVTALLARPRAIFHASPDNWHIEFAASGPTRAGYDGRQAIRLRFPDVLVTQQRRSYERIHAQPNAPLHFVVDAGGPISFHGALIDVSLGGLGFLQYPPTITLEPGTILKGSRIELPPGKWMTVDLEVRYSRMSTLPNGKRTVHSGCRFVDSAPGVKALLDSYFKP